MRHSGSSCLSFISSGNAQLEQTDDENAECERPSDCARKAEVSGDKTVLIEIHYNCKSGIPWAGRVVQHQIGQFIELERSDCSRDQNEHSHRLDPWNGDRQELMPRVGAIRTVMFVLSSFAVGVIFDLRSRQIRRAQQLPSSLAKEKSLFWSQIEALRLAKFPISFINTA